MTFNQLCNKILKKFHKKQIRHRHNFENDRSTKKHNFYTGASNYIAKWIRVRFTKKSKCVDD